MKFQAIGLACLIAGAFAAPVQEKAQNTEVQPHAPNAAPMADPIAVADPLAEEPDLGLEEDPEEETEEGIEPEMVDETANVALKDLKTLQQMANQVQQGVQALTTGVRRRQLPALEGLLGGLTGNEGNKKHKDDDDDDDERKHRHKHKHDDEDVDIDIDNRIDTDINVCSNNQKQVCCNGALNCLVVQAVAGVIGSTGCRGNSFCCNTNAAPGTAINIGALNCISLLG